MSAPIGPGDWVECVEPDAEFGTRSGHLYRVEEIYPDAADNCDHHGAGCRFPGVDIVGLAREWRCLCLGDFRPIYRPKASLIEKLKQPAPPAVRERVLDDA